MAISWGAYEGGVRVGIQVSHGAVGHNSTQVTYTFEFFTQNDQTFNDGQTMSFGGVEGGSHSFTNNAGSGTVVERHTRQYTYVYPTNSYGSSPATKSVSVTLSGLYTGGTPSKTVSFAIPARPWAAPDAPSSVAGTRINDSAIKVTWANNGTIPEPVHNNYVQRRTYFNGVWSGYSGMAYLAATTAWQDNSAIANRIFQYQVRASNDSDANKSGFVGTGHVYTTPAAPSNVTRSGNPGANQVINWTDNVGYDLYVHQVFRSANGGSYVYLADVAAGTNTYTDPTPSAATSWRYAVRAKSTPSGQNLYSALVASSTASEIQNNPPAAPTAVTNARVSDTQINVAWTNNATATAPYVNLRVQRWDNVSNAWSDRATLGVTTTYSDTTVVANRKYEYRVRAENEIGNSAYAESNDFAWTTPAAPSGAAVARINANADVQVTWTNNVAYPNADYQTEIWASENGVWQGAALTTVAGGVASYTHVGPSQVSSWAYRLRTKTTDTSPQLLSAYHYSPSTIAQTFPPLAPTDLNPNSPTKLYDPALARPLTWTYNPHELSTADQTKYQVQHRIVGAGSWTQTAEITSSVKSHTLAASTYTIEDVVEWQVRTWSDDATAGPWSASATIVFNIPPPPDEDRRLPVVLDLDTGEEEATTTRLVSTATGTALVRSVAMNNITLNGLFTLNTVVLAVGDRVLTLGQTLPEQNGIWVVTEGPWIRAFDADTSTKLVGKIAQVTEGTYAGTMWFTTFKAADTLGVTAMTWENLATFLPGMIILYAGTTAPVGFLLCQGQFVAQASYSKLFAVIGHVFNGGTDPGDGTFKLPDLRDRVPMGVSGTKTRGSTGGSETFTLATANLPSHTHTMAHTHSMAHTHAINHDHETFTTASGGGHTHTYTTSDAGSNTLRAARGSTANETVVQNDGNGAHSHFIDVPAFTGTSGASSAADTGASSAASTGTTGSGTAVTHLPKYQAVNYLIRVF